LIWFGLGEKEPRIIQKSNAMHSWPCNMQHFWRKQRSAHDNQPVLKDNESFPGNDIGG
jgi:hypothetical protein